MSAIVVNACDAADERAAAGVNTTPTLTLYRAQGLGHRVVKPIIIEIDEEFPQGLDLTTARNLHRDSAGDLAEALWQALPGGTLDALLRDLLLRRASDFEVSFDPKERP